MKAKPTLRHFLAFAGCSLLAVSSAYAQSTLYWDGGSADIVTDGNGASAGGAGTWDTTLLNWDAGASPHVAWNNSNNDTAVFAGTAGTVTLGAPITAGGLIFNTTGYSITGSTLTLAGASAPVINVSSGTSTISSNIDGTNGLQKTGGNILILSGTNNTYSGTTTISAGTLQGNKNTTGGASPFGTSTIQLNAGTLNSFTISANDSAETYTFGNDINVGGNASIFFSRSGGVGSNKTHAYGNLSIGNSTLSLTASAIAHTLSFTGANLTGDATINNATNATTNIGAITETGGPHNLTKQGGATLRLTGINTYTGTTTISGGTLEVQGSIASSSGITNNATLTFNIASAQSYSNGISGTGALTKSGAGILTLGGTNIYTGTTTVTAGALVATNTLALPGYDVAAKVIINGGTVGVQIGGSGWTTADADTLLANATKTSGAFGIDTTNGSLTQWIDFTTTNLGTALGLNKLGSNTLTLDLANSYAGATTVTAGALNIQNASALGTTAGGTTVASGAALEIQGGITTAAEALTLNGSGISNGGALRNISGNNTYAGAITLGSSARINSDAGLLTGSGTTFTLGANTLTIGGAGNTTLSNNVTGTNGSLIKEDAGTLTLTNNSNTYTGTTTISGGILEISGTGRLNSGSYAGAISIATGAALNFTSNQAQTLSGAITGAGTLTKTNAGALTLNGNNTHTVHISSATGITLPTGITTFNGDLSVTGGILTMVNGTTVSGSGLLTMSNGTQFRIGQNTSVNIGMDMKFLAGTIRAGRTTGGTGNYSYNGNLELGGNVIFGATTTSEVINAVFNGNISDGGNNYSLTFDQGQSGTVFTLAGDNTFGGGVNMNNTRTLNLNSPTALGTGTFTIGTTATLDNTSSGGAVVMTANNPQNWNSNFTFTGTNDLNMGTGAVTMNNNRIVTVTGGTLIIGGAIGQNAAGRTLAKAGAGTLVLGGANTYTGATSVTGGTLVLTGATQATSAITFTAGSLGLNTGSPVTAASAAVNLANGTIKVIGSTGAASYTLLTAASITGSPVLAEAVPGYELQVIDGVTDELRLVQTGGGSPYETWAGPGVAFGDDANGDGVSNGLAFLLGATGPNVNALNKLPTSSQTGGNLVMGFTCLATADRGTATLTLEYDGDLAGTWLSVPVPGAVGAPNPIVENTTTGSVSFVATDGGTNANGDALIIVEATISDTTESASGKLFGRVKGTNP